MPVDSRQAFFIHNMEREIKDNGLIVEVCHVELKPGIQGGMCQ